MSRLAQLSHYSTTWMTRLQFSAGAKMGLFSFAAASWPALGPTQPPTQWVPRVKWQGRESNHSPPSRAKVKNAWDYTSTPQYLFMAWCLDKRKENFTLFYFNICPYDKQQAERKR
jgi:hypothetical protein